MSRLWAVVRREYVERVRSKAFVIATVVGPLLLTGVMLGPALLMQRHKEEALRVAVIDVDGALQERLERALSARAEDGRAEFSVAPAGHGTAEERRARVRDSVLAGRLDGYVFIPPGGLEQGVAEYHGRNVSNLQAVRVIARRVDQAALEQRLTRAGISPESLQEYTRRVDIKTVKLSAEGEREDRGDTFIFALVLMMALYAALALWGAALMNGVIEEKANRVVEVIVSSIPAPTLFAGKLLGVGAAALTQLLAWAGVTALFGVWSAQAALARGASLPDVRAHVIVFLVVFFLLGFFVYGSIYAAIGAAVNSQQEAQSLIGLALVPLVAGVTLFPVVAQHPDGRLALILSLVPLWTPLLMFLRIAVLTPPAWQVALSIVLTLGAIVALNWAAARIYRVGILMYGKRPSLPEILRWLGR